MVSCAGVIPEQVRPKMSIQRCNVVFAFFNLGDQEMIVLFVQVVLVVWLFVPIFSKAGLPAALAIGMPIPFINLVLLFYLASAKWPTLPCHAPEKEQKQQQNEKATDSPTEERARRNRIVIWCLNLVIAIGLLIATISVFLPNHLPGLMLLLLILYCISYLVAVWPFCVICSKAGFDGALVGLMLIPWCGFYWLLFHLAYAKWPALLRSGPEYRTNPIGHNRSDEDKGQP